MLYIFGSSYLHRHQNCLPLKNDKRHPGDTWQIQIIAVIGFKRLNFLEDLYIKDTFCCWFCCWIIITFAVEKFIQSDTLNLCMKLYWAYIKLIIKLMSELRDSLWIFFFFKKIITNGWPRWQSLKWNVRNSFIRKVSFCYISSINLWKLKNPCVAIANNKQITR